MTAVSCLDLGSVAVCAYDWTERGQHAGQPFEFAGTATDVLVRRGAGWVHQAHHVSLQNTAAVSFAGVDPEQRSHGISPRRHEMSEPAQFVLHQQSHHGQETSTPCGLLDAATPLVSRRRQQAEERWTFPGTYGC
jgi:hypothetical protein